MRGDLYAKAELIAKLNHLGQKYADEDYFEFHVMAVVRSLEKAGFDENYLIVGLLHDAIEDGYDFAEDAVLQTMPHHIVAAVKRINKPSYVDRDTYLAELKTNELAKVVKLHDAFFNLSQCLLNKNVERADYYFDTIAALA